MAALRRLLCLGLLGGVLALAHASDGVWAPGLTEPYRDVTLAAEVPGVVAARLYREGDFVKKGQVIVELDKRLEELAVQRHKLVADQLKTDLDGTRYVFEHGKSVSAEDLAKKEVEYRVAVVDYQTAEVELRKRQVRAPMDGYITEFLVQVGESRKAQDAVVRMAETRRCYFISNVDAKLGAELRVGQAVPLEIDGSHGPVAFEGKIVFVSPVVDPASGLLRVKALFENPDGKIRPGVAGRIKLEGKPDVN
ncbi:MAG: efflux RND transporter periplasmic adaptor subunit [Verrucomicrobia bacterium]|nr:efflux RND transporter periplasmic adaptor subunit [Verrucomicrobiota bacterium]